MNALPWLPAALAFLYPAWEGGTLTENIARLASPVAAEKRQGEAWLKARGGAAITGLVSGLETGDWKEQAQAARTLMILVSPWQRGMERGRRHHGQIELFRPERPTGRPTGHPQATALQKALLGALARSLQQIKRDPAPGKEQDQYSNLGAVIADTAAALAEVADGEAVKAVTLLLEKEKDPVLGLSLMGCLETIHGLPAHFGMHGLCGVGLTPEILRRHREREAADYAERKKELLAWLGRHASLTIEERARAAIAAWAARAKANPEYFVSRGNGSPLLVLARLGEAAVPCLRAQQAGETSLRDKAFWEVVIAAITGEADGRLVGELADPRNLGDASLHHFACEIIAVSGSQAFLKELEAMLADSRYSGLEVAHALAVAHRHAALPLLRKQPKTNYVAECSVKELESWPE